MLQLQARRTHAAEQNRMVENHPSGSVCRPPIEVGIAQWKRHIHHRATPGADHMGMNVSSQIEVFDTRCLDGEDLPLLRKQMEVAIDRRLAHTWITLVNALVYLLRSRVEGGRNASEPPLEPSASVLYSAARERSLALFSLPSPTPKNFRLAVDTNPFLSIMIIVVVKNATEKIVRPRERNQHEVCLPRLRLR